MTSCLFKMLSTNYLHINRIYSICIYKEDLALNTLQRLICQTKYGMGGLAGKLLGLSRCSHEI